MYLIVDIRTKDGKKLELSCYTPEQGNGKVIIMAPTGGVTKAFYDPLARFFKGHDYSVVTFDYRGMGASLTGHLKGYKASLHQWAVQDIDAVIRYVKTHYPNQEIIYMGHCIGGEIIGLAQASQYISRLVLVNSALSCKQLWPIKDRFRIVAQKTVVGSLSKLLGYFPGKWIGHSVNMPGGVIHEWANWCSSPNGLFDIFPDNSYRNLRIPLLSFSFSDDWHCPPRAVRELLNRFDNAIITWYHIKPRDIAVKKIGKLGFYSPDMKTTLWPMLLQWLNSECCKDADYNQQPLTIQPDLTWKLKSC